MAKQPPKKKTTTPQYLPPSGGGKTRERAVDKAARDAMGAAVVEPVVNGTALAVHEASAAPSTRISLEFGIDNLVAVGVVHAENRLTPKLEQQVAEIHRLGNEVNTRGAELVEIYSKTETDPEFMADCNTLIAAAEKLGIHISVELVKGNFNPNTLKYSVTARFRGDLGVVREYSVDDDRAEEIRDEIALLRDRQTEQSKAAARTKSQLNPGWLEKQMRASIAENAMHQTESGAETLKACLDYIDRAIDGAAPVAHRQLERD